MELTAQRSSFYLNWHRLLSLSVAGNLMILIYMVVARQDMLALALGAVLLLGLGLRRFRKGAFGVFLLGLVSADIAIWTVSGAINNFLNGEAVAALILPAYLGLVSLISVIATIAVWIAHYNPDRGARVAQFTGQLGLILLVLITLATFLVRPRLVTATRPVDIQIMAENMGFEQTELISQNNQITVQFTNRDLWWHTFTLDELGVDLRVPMEAKRSVTFTALPGAYHFYCSIPGHASIMQGTLIIEEHSNGSPAGGIAVGSADY
jgi:plastocyanin